jgi:TolB-like protein
VSPALKLRRPVVAVLPFRNLSGDPALDPFVDGLTEQVGARIALRVDAISSASGLPYKGRAYDVREAGRALGATHALTGGVTREGDKARVTYEIVAVESGRQLFASVADYPAASALAAQELVATNATAATWAFVPWEWTEDPARNEVIELTQAGGLRHNMGEPETGIQMVERALELDPSYPWAHMQLAMNWGNALNSGKRSAREALAKIAFHAAEAERLAPGSYEALEASSVPDKFQLRWAENERKARASCALARHPYHCVNLQFALLDLGQTREVIEIARGQIDMLPEASIAHSIIAAALFVERRYAEAERAAMLSLQTWPPGAYTIAPVAAIRWMSGRRDAYVETLRQARLRAGDVEGAAEIARLFAAEGPEAVARWAAEHSAARPFTPPFFQEVARAVSYALAGDTDFALDRLENLPPFGDAPVILYWPVFDSLRTEPRFLAVVEKLGVTKYHAPYLERVIAERASQTAR